MFGSERNPRAETASRSSFEKRLKMDHFIIWLNSTMVVLEKNIDNIEDI